MPFDPVCLGRIGVPDAKPPPFSNGIMIYHSQARFHVGRRASPTCEGAALAASNSGSYNVRCPCEGFALTPLSRQRQSMLGMRSTAERIPSSEAGGASPFMPTRAGPGYLGAWQSTQVSTGTQAPPTGG